MNSFGYTAASFSVHNNHLFVDATIGDIKSQLMLDSGAMVSMFNQSTVEKYGMTLIKGRAVIVGFGGPVEVKTLAKTKQLKVGAGDAIAQDFYVLDMSSWPKDFTSKFDGILGCDFFKTKKAMIDYANGTLWLSQSQAPIK